jgi:hypothetical protein
MNDVKSNLETALGKFWDEQALPSNSHPEQISTVEEMELPLDSISSCEVLTIVEPILGHKVEAEDVIKKGGYASKEEFVQELSEALLRTLSGKNVS